MCFLFLTRNSNLSILEYVSLQNGEEDAGRVGLLMVLAGMLGSVLSGIVLDKTHRFK